MRSPVAELLDDLAAGLARLGIAWYVFGARAAILYGVARLTADVDVTVRLPEGTSNEMLVAGLQPHHFRARIVDPDFIERTRVMPFVHAATSLPLDLVMAGPGLEERFFSRAGVRVIEGTTVPVASAEDIIVMKLLAGRPKDVEDVVAIAASQGERLDIAYIRQTLHELEQALSQSDLVPAFEQALTRSRRARPLT
ncbi:MAG TPA: DUF6036 family nucleotidyltransferase [Vicinamibacterales bacterium]|jgi:hypothetical protein|nr:DUF6036 family nucleotidyltransferase [Vicinamibacterales bacterium]